jgi:serine protease inhibitor
MKRQELILLCALLASGCGGTGEGTDHSNPLSRRPITPMESERAAKSLSTGKPALLTASSNALGLNLFAELYKRSPDKNLTVSPASVSLALAMAYNGASGGTQLAFEKVLGVSGWSLPELNAAYKDLRTVLAAPDPKVKVEVANSVWVENGLGLKRDFVGRLEDSFGARAANLDFGAEEAPGVVNAWVAEATQKKIASIVEKFEPDTVMLLLNAVYFKGSWAVAFDPARTEKADFTLFTGKNKDVSMMSRRGQFDHLAGDKFQAVRLPYGSGRVAMYVFLPDVGSTLKQFLKELTPKSWPLWLAKFKPMEGAVYLPRFKGDSDTCLSEPLKELGLGVAFDQAKADFAAMRESAGPGKLYIQQVLHKAAIEVNEEGTEAAAATGVQVGVTAVMPDKEFVFRAERPFFFAIVDKTTGAVLFMGTMGDPS